MNYAYVILLSLLCVLELPTSATASSVYDKELLYKVRFGQAADVELLLKKGANPNQLNEVQMPLVSVAASRRDGQAIPILKALRQAKADIDQGGLSRQYPILIAARVGDKALIEYLLYEAYADTEVRDANGQQAREIATHYGHREIADMLDYIAQERDATRQAMQSPERRTQLIRDLVFHYCANNYQHYYFKSKQDPISAAKQEETLSFHKGKVTTALNDLKQVFGMNGATLLGMGQATGEPLVKELNALVSNRNRRKHGFGTPEDLHARCGRIRDQILKKSPLTISPSPAKTAIP
jgi:hypothetical protein